MKTAITVLQEMMVKFGQTPEYECISQTGPQHSATFEYRCAARGARVTAAARSKKEAKQEAARLMLLALASRGEPVPPPYGHSHAHAPPRTASSARSPQAAVEGEGGGGSGESGSGAVDARSYVALLKDLCEEYRLPGAQYELVGDTGPPHLRQFTVRMAVAAHARFATASTKKAARQLAAHQLYAYLRENLARLTRDFVEEEALARAHEKAMERYVDLREEPPWRPDLGQRVADYHASLFAHLEKEKRHEALELIEGSAEEAESVVEAAAAALGLKVQLSTQSTVGDGVLAVLELSPTLPEVALAGRSRAAAAASALRFLRLALLAAAPPEPAPAFTLVSPSY